MKILLLLISLIFLSACTTQSAIPVTNDHTTLNCKQSSIHHDIETSMVYLALYHPDKSLYYMRIDLSMEALTTDTQKNWYYTSAMLEDMFKQMNSDGLYFNIDNDVTHHILRVGILYKPDETSKNSYAKAFFGSELEILYHYDTALTDMQAKGFTCQLT